MALMPVKSMSQQDPSCWYVFSDLHFDQPSEGQYLILKDGEWYGCSPRPQPRYYIALDSIASLITRFPDCSFLISFHTDCRADSALNKQISRQRADTMQENLIRKTAAGNFRCVGAGEDEPANDCRCEGTYLAKQCREDEHEQNRRVVLRVVAKLPEN